MAQQRGQQLRVAPGLVSALAPGGVLRASINVGNPVLASRDAGSGGPAGVSVDLAREFARQLGVRAELVVFSQAAASVAAVRNEQADVGFFAVDPARGDGLFFSAPYLLIEGSYLVGESSALTGNAEVDRKGQRIAVGSGSAYDLFLTREVSQAEIVRFPGAGPALAAVRAGDAEVAAGIRQMLDEEARRAPGVRVLPGRFMVISQAMAIPASRGAQARALLAAFADQMKTSGFIANALDRHHIEGAIVAPAG